MVDIDVIDLPSSSSSSPDTFTNKKSSKSLRKSGKPYQFVPSACQVCLGKATGHHYDVASCNGCKSFFRRVTIEKLAYKCSLTNQCYENIQPGDHTPKCRSCRYKKCVEAGMNPLGIQSELRKRSEGPSSDEVNREVVVLPRILDSPKSVESQISDLIQNLVHLDLKTITFRDCSYNPTQFPTLKEVVKDEVSILGLGDRMGPMPGWPIPKEEMEKVRKANEVPGIKKTLAPNMKRWLMYDILTVMEMAKTFDFFKKLSESDRFLLFRDTLLMISNLTKAYFAYEKKIDRGIRPDGTEWPTPQTWFPKELHSKLCNDIGIRAIAALSRMEFTKIEFLLVRAILVCNAAAPDISSEARQILSVERTKYTMALLNHTMARKGIEGAGRFAELLNIIDILERQQKDLRDVNVLVTLHRRHSCRIPLFDEVMLTG